MTTQSGPSKEELDYYWKNSRQYFDQLANYYKQSDPEYYNEFIAPFYSNPFAGRSSGAAKRGCTLAGAAIAVLIAGLAGGLISYGISWFEDIKEEVIKIEKTLNGEDVSTTEENTDGNISDDEFRKLNRQSDSLLTLKYNPNDTAYVNFETLIEDKLRTIKNDDKNYDKAQQILKDIREHRIKKNKSRSLLDN